MRLLLYLFLILFALPVLAWWSLPYVLPPLIHAQAAEYDVHVHALRIDRPGLYRANVPHLKLSLADGSAIEAFGVQASWGPELPDTRRLRRVDVQRVRVQPTPVPAPAPARALPTAIPAYLLESLPLDAWSIARLEIASPEEIFQGIEKIHGVMNGNESIILVEARISAAAATYRFEAELAPGRHHAATLREAADEAPVLQLSDQRTAGDRRSDGHLQLDLARAHALLSQLGVASQWPATTGMARLHWSGELPAEIDPRQPWRGPTLEGTLEWESAITPEGGEQLRSEGALQFRLADEKISWQLAPDARLRLQHPALSEIAEDSLGATGGSVWAQVTTPGLLHGSLAPATRAFAASGSLHLELRAGNALLGHQRMDLSELQADQALQSRVRMVGSVQRISPRGSLPVREVGWQLAGQASMQADGATFQLEGPGRLRVRPDADDSSDPAALPPLRLLLRAASPLRWQRESGLLRWPGLRIATEEAAGVLLAPLLPDDVTMLDAPSPVQVQFTELSLQEGQVHLDADWNMNDLRMNPPCCEIGPLHLAGRLRIDDQKASGTTRLTAAAEGTRPDAVALLQMDWHGELAKQHLEGTFRLLPGARFPGFQAQLKQFLRPWPEGLDITRGETDMRGTFWWEPQVGLAADISLTGEDIRATYDETTARGGSFRSSPEIRATGIGLGQYMSFVIEEVDVGFPIRDIRGDLWVRVPLSRKKAPVLIRGFHASLLGGTVTAREIPLPVGRDEVTFTVDVKNIDIGQLIALQQRDDLHGTGTLDGSIPVRWSNAGVSVDAGHLAARAPGGRLAFTPDAATRAMAAGQPGLDIAVRVLKNFHYQVLRADVNYFEDGKLLLSLKIRGENPELHDGHPVHLNINLEENVLTLLKSLQYSDELTGKIEEQLERRIPQ